MLLDFFILAALLLITLWLALTEWRLRNLLRGKDARTLEGTINGIATDVEQLKSLRPRVEKSVQHVGTVRFNPWNAMGSNQSFAVAFLNGERSGVVISSLYARNQVSVFAKPIKNGQSEFELTPEEREAISTSLT